MVHSSIKVEFTFVSCSLCLGMISEKINQYLRVWGKI